MKIIHFCPNDKFIKYAVEKFNSSKESISDFYIVENGKGKTVLGKNIHYVTKLELIKLVIFSKIKGDVAIFHSLPNLFCMIVLLLRKIKTKVWIGWGYDYYRHWGKDIYIDYKVKNSSKNKIIELCIKFLNPYKRFDYFSPVLKSEFDIFKAILNARFKYVDWHYGSQKTIIKNNTDLVEKELGSNVMVGNSLDPSNNHYDVLKRIDSNRENIILPISYGGSKSYKSWLFNKLREHDCETQKLEEFLDSSQYLHILASCNVLVLNHIRQQGVGNVALALSLGITVYLNKSSPLYLELRSKGFYIFETDSISNESNLLRLSYNEIERNKELSIQHFYCEVEDTKRLIEMVKNEKVV